MKFSGNTQDILEGLNIATRALAPKVAKPVYEGVFVECQDNTISLTCSDGQMSVRWTGNVDVSEPGQAIIQGKLFSELFHKIPNTLTTIKTDDKSALITYNKSRSRLSLLTGEYPMPRAVDTAHTVTISALTLKNMITHVLPTIATDQSRVILTGAFMEVSPDAVTLVSLDGFRLSSITSAQQNGPDSFSAVIPRKPLTDLSRILPNTDEPVTISIDNGTAQFRFASVQMTSALLAGEYIDYKRIIPQDFPMSIRVDKATLSAALDRASIMAREGKNNLIRFTISQNTLNLSSQSETGSVDESMDCLQYGDDLTIAFNSAYISDAIRTATGDNVTFKFTNPSSPCVISPESGDDWMMLILPVRTH